MNHDPVKPIRQRADSTSVSVDSSGSKKLALSEKKSISPAPKAALGGVLAVAADELVLDGVGADLIANTAVSSQPALDEVIPAVTDFMQWLSQTVPLENLVLGIGVTAVLAGTSYLSRKLKDTFSADSLVQPESISTVVNLRPAQQPPYERKSVGKCTESHIQAYAEMKDLMIQSFNRAAEELPVSIQNSIVFQEAYQRLQARKSGEILNAKDRLIKQLRDSPAKQPLLTHDELVEHFQQYDAVKPKEGLAVNPNSSAIQHKLNAQIAYLNTLQNFTSSRAYLLSQVREIERKIIEIKAAISEKSASSNKGQVSEQQRHKWYTPVLNGMKRIFLGRSNTQTSTKGKPARNPMMPKMVAPTLVSTFKGLKNQQEQLNNQLRAIACQIKLLEDHHQDEAKLDDKGYASLPLAQCLQLKAVLNDIETEETFAKHLFIQAREGQDVEVLCRRYEKLNGLSLLPPKILNDDVRPALTFVTQQVSELAKKSLSLEYDANRRISLANEDNEYRLENSTQEIVGSVKKTLGDFGRINAQMVEQLGALALKSAAYAKLESFIAMLSDYQFFLSVVLLEMSRQDHIEKLALKLQEKFKSGAQNSVDISVMAGVLADGLVAGLGFSVEYGQKIAFGSSENGQELFKAKTQSIKARIEAIIISGLASCGFTAASEHLKAEIQSPLGFAQQLDNDYLHAKSIPNQFDPKRLATQLFDEVILGGIVENSHSEANFALSESVYQDFRLRMYQCYPSLWKEMCGKALLPSLRNQNAHEINKITLSATVDAVIGLDKRHSMKMKLSVQEAEQIRKKRHFIDLYILNRQQGKLSFDGLADQLNSANTDAPELRLYLDRNLIGSLCGQKIKHKSGKGPKYEEFAALEVRLDQHKFDVSELMQLSGHLTSHYGKLQHCMNKFAEYQLAQSAEALDKLMRDPIIKEVVYKVMDHTSNPIKQLRRMFGKGSKEELILYRNVFLSLIAYESMLQKCQKALVKIKHEKPKPEADFLVKEINTIEYFVQDISGIKRDCMYQMTFVNNSINPESNAIFHGLTLLEDVSHTKEKKIQGEYTLSLHLSSNNYLKLGSQVTFTHIEDKINNDNNTKLELSFKLSENHSDKLPVIIPKLLQNVSNISLSTSDQKVMQIGNNDSLNLDKASADGVFQEVLEFLSVNKNLRLKGDITIECQKDETGWHFAGLNILCKGEDESKGNSHSGIDDLSKLSSTSLGGKVSIPVATGVKAQLGMRLAVERTSGTQKHPAPTSFAFWKNSPESIKNSPHAKQLLLNLGNPEKYPNLKRDLLKTAVNIQAWIEKKLTSDRLDDEGAQVLFQVYARLDKLGLTKKNIYEMYKRFLSQCEDYVQSASLVKENQLTYELTALLEINQMVSPSASIL